MLNKEFNIWQRDYTAKIRRWVPHYDQLMEAMVQFPEENQPLDILDLGCGNGNAVALLLEQFPTAEYTLVDASEDMIGACRQRFQEQTNLVYAEKYFQDLSFLPESFDIVLAGLSFHHLNGPEKQALFGEIYRWLRPGGVLSASDLYASKKWENYQTDVLEIWEAIAKSQGTPEEEWTNMLEHHEQFDFPDAFEDQISWMKEAGFEEVKITFVKGHWGTVQARK